LFGSPRRGGTKGFSYVVFDAPAAIPFPQIPGMTGCSLSSRARNCIDQVTRRSLT